LDWAVSGANETCYHLYVDGEIGGTLSHFSLSRMSFRWQVSLLGTLVVILSLAVCYASVATLRYTKSAVLNSESKRLSEAARSLAHEYEDRADAALQKGQKPPLDSLDVPASREVMGLVSRMVLQNLDGVAGGFYSSSAQALVGNFYPSGPPSLSSENHAIPGAEQEVLLQTARQALAERRRSEQVVKDGNGFLLVSAVPLREGDSVVGSAWATKRLYDVPGANRFRAYLVTAGLAATALASVFLTLLMIRNLQGGVRKIEGGLQTLEGDLTSQITTAEEPAEIQRIVQAINRLGKTLKEKIQYEKQIEGQLRHAERLASLGRLVAGVAHEVRNPLATIRLRVQMCSRATVDPKIRESCSVALQEIERLNGIVNRLLNFSRPIQLELGPVDLRNLVRERVRFFEEFACGHHVQLMTNFPNRICLTLVDKDRLAQVFDNIIQNALDAMPDQGGTLSVTVASELKQDERGGGLAVIFEDTGTGITPTIAGHVFEPFFTTKPSGTGLGLSISHELIRAHGGDIQIDSVEGRGTNVRVTIPASLTL